MADRESDLRAFIHEEMLLSEKRMERHDRWMAARLEAVEQRLQVEARAAQAAAEASRVAAEATRAESKAVVDGLMRVIDRLDRLDPGTGPAPA